jgi:hypothetical protein
MVAGMTPRSRLAFLVVAALAAMSSALIVGDAFRDAPPPASSSLVEATDGPSPLLATPARLYSMSAVLRAMPLASGAVALVAAAAGVIGRRHPRLQRLQVRIGDVGDAWRALLLGAPPTLL